jgi:hypothetical protein
MLSAGRENCQEFLFSPPSLSFRIPLWDEEPIDLTAAKPPPNVMPLLSGIKPSPKSLP